MFKKLFLFSYLIFWLICYGYSQDTIKMNMWQDSLLSINNRSLQTRSEVEQIESNYKFVKTLVSSLKETNAFNFKYEKLKAISIVNAANNAFRIFSWNIPLNDGSYLYYGAIQFRSETLKLIPLLDKTFEIKDVDVEVLKPDNWYGACYYDIVQLNSNQYILLGWKGHHSDFSKKVIEIISFLPNAEVVFGAKVFSDLPTYTRKIFSYSRQTSMYLKYNEEKHQLEFDHIVAAEPNLKGNYQYYGPDLTYDAYLINKNGLKLNENIELKNGPDINDDKNINPFKSNTRKSGLR